jgi:hypothetical protein
MGRWWALFRGGIWWGLWQNKKESSFSEEKRSKKDFPTLARVPSRKSFLVLFFKKEHAYFIPRSTAAVASSAG